MKYIVYQAPGTGFKSYIIFSETTRHDSFINIGKIIGAGFCQLMLSGEIDHEYPVFGCYGESTSLEIKSRGELDSEILNKGDY